MIIEHASMSWSCYPAISSIYRSIRLATKWGVVTRPAGICPKIVAQPIEHKRAQINSCRECACNSCTALSSHNDSSNRIPSQIQTHMMHMNNIAPSAVHVTIRQAGCYLKCSHRCRSQTRHTPVHLESIVLLYLGSPAQTKDRHVYIYHVIYIWFRIHSGWSFTIRQNIIINICMHPASAKQQASTKISPTEGSTLCQTTSDRRHRRACTLQSPALHMHAE